MKVLACGSRGFGDADTIRMAFGKLTSLSTEPITIIEGGARGADILARQVAEELGYEVEEYPADWEQHGRAAGVIRNQRMLDEGRPDLVLAFGLTIPLTPGTSDMIRRAKEARVRVVIYLSHETHD